MRTSARVASRGKGKTEGPARVERGGRNVFADLGLPDAEALFAKSQLVSRICSLIERRGLTQTEAAKLLGVGQPKVSALMRGHLDGFSSDRLFRFLNALGRDVEIRVRPRSRSQRAARLRVVDEVA